MSLILYRSIRMMLLFGLFAATVNSPADRAELKLVPAKSASAEPCGPTSGLLAENCGVIPMRGRLVTRMVPAPAEATLSTMKLMSLAAPMATVCMVACAVAGLAAAAGKAWKMLLAPPRMLTRSLAPKVPPPPM